MLVLLLRLRQICNHPALISEREGDSEAMGRTRAEAEVARAVRSFGADFVSKVRSKIRDLETERMEVELTVRKHGPPLSADDLTKVQQQSGDESQDGQVEECPICFDVLSDGVVTGCCHIFCRECISKSCPIRSYLRDLSIFLPQPAGILNSPPTNNAQNMNEDERPCELHFFRQAHTGAAHLLPLGPSCRQPISSSKLFTLEAFNSPKRSTSLRKGKRKASARSGSGTDSMDVDESDSDDSFIVPDDDDFIVFDDDDDNKPPRKKKHAKRNVVLSDDDDDEFDDVIISAPKPEAKPKASVGEMNEDEISTKMQVRIHLPRVVLQCSPRFRG